MMLLDRLYGAITAARNSLYDRGVFSSRRLTWPVVSVGNISAGGSGKTPFVIALGELLQTRKIAFDVLSRGYRRSTHGVLTVDPEGTPEQFGDEPLLIARKLRCPVIVGKRRYFAGMHAEHDRQTQSGSIHLLDDGFQHRELYRDFNIVLLNREDLDDKLLPLGRLREPLSSLARADAVVVGSDFPVERLPRADFQVWRVERLLELTKITTPVMAFCGIARPERFFSELRKSGVDLRKEIAFRDHHRYTAGDVQQLAAAQARIPGSTLVTTEKDAINLGKHVSVLNPTIVGMKMQLLFPDAALDCIFTKIAKRRG